MSSYDYPRILVDMTSNILDKVKYHSRYRAKGAKQELKLVVYGDEEPLSYRMWRSIFPDELMNYTAHFSLIPIPADCTPERYEQYRIELREYIAIWAARDNFIWGLYNLAAPEQEPRIHLVIAKRRVKRSELQRWAHTEKSESLDNDGAHQDARFISIESLRGLVSDILDFDPPSSLQEVSSATSLSSSTISDERSADPFSSEQEASSATSTWMTSSMKEIMSSLVQWNEAESLRSSRTCSSMANS